jgi:hypothetical protein
MKCKSCLSICVLIALSCSVHAADKELSISSLPAVVVKTVPESGEVKADPNITEVRVTFSKKMQDGRWSWGQMSDETYPKTTGKPHYLPDGRTCVLPVALEAGKTYVLQINALSGKFHIFADTNQQPSVPYLLVFETRGARTEIDQEKSGAK